MLPAKTIQDLYYPMTAELYYSRSEQNDFGEIEKIWLMDRTIRCSAIKESPQSQIRPALSDKRFFDYEQKIKFRTDEDIFVSRDYSQYHITDILITNIKDEDGNLPWKERDDKPTCFEIENVEPMYNELHNLSGYRILLARSDFQGDIDVFY